MTTEIEDAVQDQRQDMIAARGETEATLQEGFPPGSFGCHEAMHLATVFADLVERELLDHCAVLANAEWFALAHQAVEALTSLHMAIGEAHVIASGPEPSDD